MPLWRCAPSLALAMLRTAGKGTTPSLRGGPCSASLAWATPVAHLARGTKPLCGKFCTAALCFL